MLLAGIDPGLRRPAEYANYARSVPSDWTGSPQDVAAALDAAASRIVAAEARITALETRRRFEGYGERTSDLTRTTSILLTDPALATGIIPGDSEFLFTGSMLYDPTAAGDFQFGLLAGASVTFDVTAYATASAANQIRAMYWLDEAATPSFSWNTANAIEQVHWIGVVRTTTSSTGTIGVQWAPLNGGNSTTVKQAWARLIQINEQT